MAASGATMYIVVACGGIVLRVETEDLPCGGVSGSVRGSLRSLPLRIVRRYHGAPGEEDDSRL